MSKDNQTYAVQCCDYLLFYTTKFYKKGSYRYSIITWVPELNIQYKYEYFNIRAEVLLTSKNTSSFECEYESEYLKKYWSSTRVRSIFREATTMYSGA